MKPSPGPWRWNSDRTMLWYEGSDEDKRSLRAGGWGPTAGNQMAILTCGVEGSGEPDADDATLIALAPEMRDALLKLEWVPHDEMGGEYCPVCTSFREPGLTQSPGSHLNCWLGALLEKLR